MIYDSPRPKASEVLAETTDSLPLKGPVRDQPLPAGAAAWTLQAAAVHPLVGTTMEAAPWIVLIGGVALSILIGTIVEVEARRRKSAVALYDSEHRLAETLQRSLLPDFPACPGLAWRRPDLPGAAHQEIGGNWFDVFTLDDGRVGLVIGDVVGHDITAAAAMSKVQSTLRAAAWSGAQPCDVLDQLEGLIATFEITELVTVFYGVLELPDHEGQRTLTYANAGHLPPLVRSADGHVEALTAGSSVLLGAPTSPSERVDLRPDTCSAPDRSSCYSPTAWSRFREPHLPRRSPEFKPRSPMPLSAPEALCDLVLAHIDSGQLRDDVAVLAVHLDEAPLLAGRRPSPRSPAARVAVLTTSSRPVF